MSNEKIVFSPKLLFRMGHSLHIDWVQMVINMIFLCRETSPHPAFLLLYFNAVVKKYLGQKQEIQLKESENRQR